MNADERQLITDLFDRMGGVRLADKDRDAEALIATRIRQLPDAAYMMVQQVLIQEHTMKVAEQRILDLEDQVRRAGEGRSSGGGSFLGGLFGGSAASRQSSVPPVGSGRGPAPEARPGYDDGGGAAPGPWRQAPPQQPMAQPMASGGAGGFLRSAMTTATGVAGGMLMGDALRGLMHGGSGVHPAAAAESAQNDQRAADEAQDIAQDAEESDNSSDWASGGDDSGSTDV